MTAAFRDEARAAVADIAGRFPYRRITLDDDRRIRVIEESNDAGESTRQAQALQALLYERGLGWVTGPLEYGGRELTAADETVLDQFVEEAGLPSRNPLLVGLQILAPAVLKHGGDELRRRLLPALFSGGAVGCQLFSEPEAGSDLAGVQTRAVQAGDSWVVSGQKVWTSQAHVADVGEALVRTDPDVPKHAGLTMLLVDMHAPGVTVRPLRQMTGGAAFNEVFLDEVRVPDRDRIGPVGEGWRVAGTSLASERGSMAGAHGPLSGAIRGRFRDLAARELDLADGVLVDDVARTVGAVVAARAVLDDPVVSGSVQKMLMVRAIDRIARTAGLLLGPRAWLDEGEPESYAWSEFALGAPGIHLAGGTDEIQRTLVAQRDLGLPRST